MNTQPSTWSEWLLSWLPSFAQDTVEEPAAQEIGNARLVLVLGELEPRERQRLLASLPRCEQRLEFSELATLSEFLVATRAWPSDGTATQQVCWLNAQLTSGSRVRRKQLRAQLRRLLATEQQQCLLGAPDVQQLGSLLGEEEFRAQIEALLLKPSQLSEEELAQLAATLGWDAAPSAATEHWLLWSAATRRLTAAKELAASD